MWSVVLRRCDRTGGYLLFQPFQIHLDRRLLAPAARLKRLGALEQQLNALVAPALVHLRADAQEHIVFQQVAILLVAPGERDELDCRLQILQHRHQHTVALLGRQPPRLQDHPGEYERLPDLLLADLAERRDVVQIQHLQRLRERVIRDIHTQQLLLPGELLLVILRRLLDGRQRDGLDTYAGRAAAPAEEVEHAGLAGLTSPLSFDPGRERLVEDREFLPPPAGQPVHRAALDQALQRALVERRALDPVAEILERAERPALITRLQDRADRPLADVLDRRQAEPNAARVGDARRKWLVQLLDREAHVRGVDIGG